VGLNIMRCRERTAPKHHLFDFTDFFQVNSQLARQLQ